MAPNTLGDGTGCDNMTAVIVKFKSSLTSSSSAEESKSAKRPNPSTTEEDSSSANKDSEATAEEGKEPASKKSKIEEEEPEKKPSATASESAKTSS